jgi:hypothetical protein
MTIYQSIPYLQHSCNVRRKGTCFCITLNPSPNTVVVYYHLYKITTSVCISNYNTLFLYTNVNELHKNVNS